MYEAVDDTKAVTFTVYIEYKYIYISKCINKIFYKHSKIVVYSKIFFFSFVQHRCIKLIKSESKDICNKV